MPEIGCPQKAVNKGITMNNNFKIYNVFQKRMFPNNGIIMKFLLS